LNPSLLSMGSALNAVFAPTTQTLDGVSQPYSGWAQQLLSGSCSPTVAQALLPFPQYCGSLTGENENEGTSHYNSFQAKWGRSLSGGLYLEANYTYSHLTTDAASTTQSGSAGYGAVGNIINPYQGYRNMSISPDDIANVASIMAVYDVPFGKGKQFLNNEGVLGHVLGGWTLATTMKFTSGMPFYFWDSAVCGLPGQFQAACIPAITGNVLAQSWGNVDVNKPMFNASAFTPVSAFNGFYLGTGPRVSTVRGSPYRDVNISLARKFAIKERLNFELRAEAFNAFNNHYFTCDGEAFGDCIPFNNDPSSANFGTWNGTVSGARSIQMVGRITF
jgi:hypothetical protein